MRTLDAREQAWVDRMRAEYSHVPIFPLDHLRGLPQAANFDGGIYFLWQGDTLQYIGQSTHIAYRLQLQEQANLYGDSRAHRMKRIPFDRHTALVLDSGRVIAPDLHETLQAVERAYIAAYCPPFNFIGQNPGT